MAKNKFPTLIYAIRCGLHEENCYEKAGQLCAAGYDMLDSNTGSVILPSASGPVGGSRRTMLIQCK
jgi:hypothetical protein